MRKPRRSEGRLYLTLQSQRALGLAEEAAGQWGFDQIGTECLLLGLLRERGSLATRLLLDLDIDPDEVCRDVEWRIGSGA